MIDSLTVFYSVLSVSLFVPVAAGLHSRRPAVPEALAAIAAGVAVLAAVRLSGIGTASRLLDPALLGIAGSALAFGVVFIMRSARRPA